MKAYSTASGGVIFVPDTVARKGDAEVISYSHVVREDANVMKDARPLTAPDYSVSVEMLKTA